MTVVPALLLILSVFMNIHVHLYISLTLEDLKHKIRETYRHFDTVHFIFKRVLFLSLNVFLSWILKKCKLFHKGIYGKLLFIQYWEKAFFKTQILWLIFLVSLLIVFDLNFNLILITQKYMAPFRQNFYIRVAWKMNKFPWMGNFRVPAHHLSLLLVFISLWGGPQAHSHHQILSRGVEIWFLWTCSLASSNF